MNTLNFFEDIPIWVYWTVVVLVFVVMQVLAVRQYRQKVANRFAERLADFHLLLTAIKEQNEEEERRLTTKYRKDAAFLERVLTAKRIT